MIVWHHVNNNLTLSEAIGFLLNDKVSFLSDQVETSARKLLGEDVLIRNLSDLDSLAKSEDDADKDSKDPEVVKAVIKVVVIGTIYKNQPLKPSILKDLSEEQVRIQANFLVSLTQHLLQVWGLGY